MAGVTPEEFKDGNKEFGNPGRRGRRTVRLVPEISVFLSNFFHVIFPELELRLRLALLQEMYTPAELF